MSRNGNRLLRYGVFLLACTFTLPTSARIKCWTNHEGVQECGDAVPPEFAQKAYEELNEHGITVEQHQRAKTDAELAEEERLAKIRQQEEEENAKRIARDRVLLDTYSDVEDLKLAREGQIATLESQIKLIQNRIAKSQANLNEFMQLAADRERRGEPPSEGILDNIESVREEIASSRQLVAKKRDEQEAIRKLFDDYIKRFRELKSQNTAKISAE